MLEAIKCSNAQILRALLFSTENQLADIDKSKFSAFAHENRECAPWNTWFQSRVLPPSLQEQQEQFS